MITNQPTLKLRHVKQCVFPYNYFKTGEESVVRGIIGNDADIIGIYKKNTILPNNRVIVVVEYDSIDFDSFIIYKAVNPKSVHTGSNYVVVNDNTDIVNNIKNNVPVKLYKISTSELNSSLDYCYFTIRTLVEEKYKTEFNYYGKQLEGILSSSKTEIYSAGIIAFLQSIRLDALDKLSGVFSAISLTADDFVSDIKHLYSLEIVDLCNDKATKISDQTFSNFLIKYVFVDKKLIPLDLMIKVCFSFNKIRTISACNILLNVFSDSNVRSYLEEQINKLWDEIKNDNDMFPEFFKSFHMIRPTETLLLLQERVENESPVDFDAATIDFKINNDGIQISDEIIELLCSFNNCEQMSEAIELLLEYYTKRPDLFNEVYTAFIREFGIDKDSERFKYCSISKAVEHLCNYIKSNNINIAIDKNICLIKLSKFITII